MALVALVGVLLVLPVRGRMTQTSEVRDVQARALWLARSSDALQVRLGAHAPRAVADFARGGYPVATPRKKLDPEIAKIVHVGALLQGTVTAVKPYGVFVDLGGISGLLHISQISADRVTNCGDILPLGSQIKVMVITVNKAKGQVGLSTKVLEPEPGDMIRNPAKVFAEAEASAAKYAWRKADEAAMQAEAAKELLLDASLFGPRAWLPVVGSPTDEYPDGTPPRNDDMP